MDEKELWLRILHPTCLGDFSILRENRCFSNNSCSYFLICLSKTEKNPERATIMWLFKAWMDGKITFHRLVMTWLRKLD